MTIDGQSKSSRRNVFHKERKAYVNIFDMEITQLQEMSSKIMKLLQENVEDQ